MVKELFKQLPHQRKLDEEQQVSARSLLSLKANKKMVLDKMSQESGKVVLLKDLSNLMRRKSTDVRNDLGQMVKLLTEKYGEGSYNVV